MVYVYFLVRLGFTDTPEHRNFFLAHLPAQIFGGKFAAEEISQTGAPQCKGNAFRTVPKRASGQNVSAGESACGGTFAVG